MSVNLITSPKGEIQFLALNRKVAKDLKPDSAQGYAIRLKFDGNTEEGKAFKDVISKINPNLIGSKHVDVKGEYTVRAFTQFELSVVDAAGNNMEEKPNFYKDSKGIARLIVQPYTKNELGGTINLIGVVIHSLEAGEATSEGSTGTSSRDDLRAALQAAIDGVTKD